MFLQTSPFISIHALPAEGDPCYLGGFPLSVVFQSTPSPRRATEIPSILRALHTISIHALPAEGDPWSCICRPPSLCYFNPRPPRGGRPDTRRAIADLYRIFQSTPSPRRATGAGLILWTCREDFNPRPPRGGRRFHPVLLQCTALFQSTPSPRRATQWGQNLKSSV